MNNEPKSSRMENGIEICNTCVREVSTPFRYKNHNGEMRGCIAKCHDKHVARNTKPNWMSPRMIKPKWVSEAQKAFKSKFGATA